MPGGIARDFGLPHPPRRGVYNVEQTVGIIANKVLGIVKVVFAFCTGCFWNHGRGDHIAVIPPIGHLSLELSNNNSCGMLRM